jgi:hypothetical protein
VGRRLALTWLLFGSLLLVFSAGALATTRTVTSTANSGPGSLRQVIASSSAGDTVKIPAKASHYSLSSQIDITVPLTIEGAGASSSVIDAGGKSRAFEITSAVPSTATTTFKDLTITNGSTTVAPGGGAILVDSGALAVTGAAITNSTATVDVGSTGKGGGGGIYNNGGNTTLTNAAVSSDTANVTDTTGGLDGGGGLYQNVGTITLIGSQLNNDTTTVNASDTGSNSDACCDGGGAVYQNAGATGAVSVTNSTLDHDGAAVNSGNCCHGGGAMYLDVRDATPFTVSGSHFDHDPTTVTTKLQGDACCSGGGAIYTFSGIDAHSSTFDSNSATTTGQECCNGGGAFYADANSPSYNFTDTDLSGNATSISGPGTGGSSDTCCNGGGALQMLLNNGPLTVKDSTLADNVAKISGTTISGGGAVYEDEDRPQNSYSNTTISGNRTSADGALQGGGGLYVYNGSAAVDTLENVTLSGNFAKAGSAGGILNIAGDVHSINTIIAVNHARTNVNCEADNYNGSTATFSSGGNNIDSTDQCNFHAGGDHINTNPLLGPLQLNGGLFSTMALHDHSPAINAGANASCPTTDERGVTRPQPAGGICDIGAYEDTPPFAVTAAPSKLSAGSAVLHGVVNPANLTTSYHFQYGTTTSYGHSSASKSARYGYAKHAVSITLKGLKRRTTYHYRIVATNQIGTTVGADETLTTAPGLGLVGHLGFVSSGGSARLFAGCFGIACTGSVTLIAGKKTVGKASHVELAGNQGRLIRVSLNAKGRQLLAKAKRHHLKATVVLTDSFGNIARRGITLVDASTTAGAAAAAASPAADVFGHTGFVSSSGHALLAVGCFATNVCTGKLLLGVGQATASYRLGAQRAAVLRVGISRAARKTLARKGHISTKLTLTDSANHRTQHETVTLVGYR